MIVSTINNCNRDRATVEDLINSIVLAFQADPIVRWMYPTQKEYLQSFPKFVQTFASKAFEHNTVFSTKDGAGGAFWIPPEIELETDAIANLIQQTVSEPTQDRVFQLLEQMDNFHPNESCWYLAILGVDPAKQKRGYGSMLIQQVLNHCDRHSQLAYLESSNPVNIPFYRKYGFEVIGEIQVGNSPIMFPMVRYPQNN